MSYQVWVAYFNGLLNCKRCKYESSKIKFMTCTFFVVIVEKDKTHQFGNWKNAWKKVLMPSISSCSISASPKRKNDLCRFLSCGQRVLHATITNRSFHSIISVQEVNYQLVLEVGWYKLWLWLAQECIFSEKNSDNAQPLDTSHGNGN